MLIKFTCEYICTPLLAPEVLPFIIGKINGYAIHGHVKCKHQWKNVYNYVMYNRKLQVLPT